MLRTGALALAASVLLLHVATAEACVAIRYDMAGITAESMARGMVNDAASIELMRVVSREPTRSDAIYAEYFDVPYLFKLKTLMPLKGVAAGSLALHGLNENWRSQYDPPGWNPPPKRPLWWASEGGYMILQDLVFPDPKDSGSVACAAISTFELGADYLVFRDRSDGLLPPGLGRKYRPPRATTAGDRARERRQRSLAIGSAARDLRARVSIVEAAEICYKNMYGRHRHAPEARRSPP